MAPEEDNIDQYFPRNSLNNGPKQTDMLIYTTGQGSKFGYITLFWRNSST